MVRTALTLLLCLATSPAFSQSTYVSGAVGSYTPFTTRVDTTGNDDRNPGTAWAVGARAGMALGSQWGVEIEFTHGLEVKKRGRLGPVPLASGGVGTSLVNLPPNVAAIFPVFDVEVHRSNTSISPVAWFSHTMTNRVDLVFVGGLNFDSTETRQQFQFPRLLTLPPNVAVSVLPNSIEMDEHSVGALAGVEARMAFGDHLRIVPGVRMHGVSGGWAIRPSVALGWQF